MGSSRKEKTLTGAGDVIRILPTGTVFLFQFLSPVVTNSGGHCDPFNKSLSLILILFCGLSCFLSSFTDSYSAHDGSVHWGFATLHGIWPPPPPPDSDSLDLSAHALRLGDFVHATLSVMVFGVLVVLDTDTVRCLFPRSVAEDRTLVQVLPPLVGALSSVVFVMFPNTRHGIGYHSTATSIGVRKAAALS